MNTIDEFIKYLCDELAIQKGELASATLFKEHFAWSSLNALLILAKIYDETGIVVTSADLKEVDTVQHFYELLLLKKKLT